MGEQSLKTKLTAYTGEFMAAVLLIQPLLDVLSYFMQAYGSTVVTTALRMVLLLAVSFYGFAISNRKQLYIACYALLGGFWFLHMLNCFRTGYQQPVGDAAEYLKLIQFPLWTLSFVTFFQEYEGLNTRVLGILTVNFAIILLVIGLSYVTGLRVYTYDFPERNIQIGILGWFGVANAQSAVLSLLVPAVLLWGLRTERLWIFCLCGIAGFGLLYFTGTRLTFYTAVLVASAFLILILLCRKPLIFALPMLAALILLLVFRGASPMEARQAVSGTSFSVYQEKIDSIMGEDKDFSYKKGEEIPPTVLKKIERVYQNIYGKQGVYKEVLLEDLLERFGLPKVLEEFDYTISAKNLNNSRQRKLKAMDMVWEEQDFLTHLLGMEYASAQIGGHNYDPENDFPALLYNVGYLGTALYLCFILGLLFYGLREFIQRFPVLLTPEFVTAAMMLVLALGSAQLSGQVLRKPNVTVYASLAAAMLYVQAREAPSLTRLRPGYKRNPAVYLKKIG